MIAEVFHELSDTAVDSCTLNNALNIAQLAVLVALLRWVRPIADRREP